IFSSHFHVSAARSPSAIGETNDALFAAKRFGELPLAARRVRVSGVEKIPIGGERDGGHLAFRFEHGSFMPLVIPDTQRVIFAAGGEPGTVGAERPGGD